MTNEQLLIFITQLRIQLHEEIKKLRQLLPDTMETHSNSKVLGEIMYGDYKALDGLNAIEDNLLSYQDMLINRNISRPVITRHHYNNPT